MIGEKTANPSKEKRKKGRNLLGQNRSFHSQTHRLYSTTHTVQQRLHTPGISSPHDMGER